MAHLAIDPEQVRAGVGYAGYDGQIEGDRTSYAGQPGWLLGAVRLLVVLLIEDINGIGTLAATNQNDAEERRNPQEPALESALAFPRQGPVSNRWDRI
jgi:hypothetical protein